MNSIPMIQTFKRRVKDMITRHGFTIQFQTSITNYTTILTPIDASVQIRQIAAFAQHAGPTRVPWR